MVRVGVAGPSIPFKDVADVSTVADIDDPDPILHCLAAGDNDNLFVAATDPIAKIAAKARDAAYEWRNGTKQTNHRKRISGCADGLTIVDQFIGKNGKLRGFGMRLKNGQIVDVLALQPVFPLYETKLRPTDAPLRRMSRAAIKDTIHSKLISNASNASSDGVRFKKCNTPCLALVESKIADPFRIYNKYKRDFGLLLQIILHKFSASLNEDQYGNIDSRLIDEFIMQNVEETNNTQRDYKEKMDLNFTYGKIKVPRGSAKSIAFFLKKYSQDSLFIQSFKRCQYAVNFFDDESRISRHTVNISCNHNSAWADQTLEKDPLYYDKPTRSASKYWLYIEPTKTVWRMKNVANYKQATKLAGNNATLITFRTIDTSYITTPCKPRPPLFWVSIQRKGVASVSEIME